MRTPFMTNETVAIERIVRTRTQSRGPGRGEYEKKAIVWQVVYDSGLNAHDASGQPSKEIFEFTKKKEAMKKYRDFQRKMETNRNRRVAAY
jgi:hypothetical protein